MDIRIMLLIFLCTLGKLVLADECGTRFTDFTSSTALAQIVLKGTINDFNAASSHSQVRSANVTVQKVYKGMDVLKEFNRSVQEGDDVIVHHFGVEDRDKCVAPDNENDKRRIKVFFLRQSSHRGMLRLSAMPVLAPSSMDRRMRRSMCDTCLKPPQIKRITCKDCAKEPTIKTMKSKKAKVGRKARLKCSARGKPTPTVTWTKGNIPILSGTGGITIKTSGKTSILIFSRVLNVHSGRYKCIATNEVGSTEEVVTLDVTSRRARPAHTIETAPDRVPCQHNPCLNGGSCIFSPSLNRRRCLCTPGFEGVQCENDDSTNTDSINQHFDRVPAVAVPDASNTNRNMQSVKNNVSTSTGTQTDVNEIQIQTGNSFQFANHNSTLAAATPTTTPRITTSSTTLHIPTPSPSRATSSTTERFVFQPKLPVISNSNTAGQILPSYPVSRKSKLKTIPCKEKHYCLNWGKCRYVRKINRKFCKCRSGFAGLRCEQTLL